jgi:tetratricopeptide (TPR) repeat protein
MSDPLSTHPLRAPEPRDDAEREARIEELLLSGLDHYFAGQYERAISVWTRIVFLDRHHDRAHAYIERARSAHAERQRESDEILHTGVEAYNAGDIDRARELLTQAVEQGTDGADVLLGRLNRVGTTVTTAVGPSPEPRARIAGSSHRVTLGQRRRGWTAMALVACGVAVTMLLGGLPLGTWLSQPQVTVSPAAPQAVVEEPVPVVRPSETALARAQALYAGGQLHGALQALDRIAPADPLRPDADRLRGDIQRGLLAAAGLPVGPQVEGATRP